MAVYARGYRRYDGGFGFHLPQLTIAWESIKQMHRGWGIRILWLIQLLLMVITGAAAYTTLNLQRLIGRSFSGGQEPTPERIRQTVNEGLDATLSGMFILPQMTLSILIAIIVGSGLIANDLRTRSMSLYFARPLRRIDYAVGKALVLPIMLIPVTLLPGFYLLSLYGLWHPVDSWGTFMASRLDLVGILLRNYFVVATSYTGLLLILSSSSSRAGMVKGLAAVVLFAGWVIGPFLGGLPGWLGDVMLYLGLPGNALPEFQQLAFAGRRMHGIARFDLPNIWVSMLLGIGILLTGVFVVWRRARSAEVVG